jgi:hypothetical protein
MSYMRWRNVAEKTEFRITTQHLALLREAVVTWNDDSMGAPTIDPKNPYGSGGSARRPVNLQGYYARIAEIVAVGWADMDEITRTTYIDEHEGLLYRLHIETGLALQIILCTGLARPGTYTRVPDSGQWVRKDESMIEPSPASDTQHGAIRYTGDNGVSVEEWLGKAFHRFHGGLQEDDPVCVWFRIGESLGDRLAFAMPGDYIVRFTNAQGTRYQVFSAQEFAPMRDGLFGLGSTIEGEPQ